MEGREDPREAARAAFRNIQKHRVDIVKMMQALREQRGNINYTSELEGIENRMKECRLACMTAIFCDFEYACEKNVEDLLWQAHSFLNSEYRKILASLSTGNQVVQKRKVDKLYRDFLKTSQSFYIGYVQRLSAQFYIPELRQAAQGLNIQPPAPVGSDGQPPPANSSALKACRMTLIHLGDLARYRCQATDRPSKASFDTSLAYYRLAAILDPDDGVPHHQMGVLYQQENRHFDILYHFHRAMAIAKPHVLAPLNLEREFKSLLSHPSSSRKAGGKDQSSPLMSWFVQLHAHYFKGETFSQQAELESEVLHRIELATRQPDQKLVLLKIVLLNIAANEIATAKVKDNWSMAASQSCQFVLRFNLRTVLTLVRLLLTAAQGDETFLLPPTRDGDENPSGTPYSPLVEILLPLVRLYIAWVYTTRADFVQYQEFLEPTIRDVYRQLADCLSFLSPQIGVNFSATESKYLLWEDTEAIGLVALSDKKLPLFFTTEEVKDSRPPKRRKVRKPIKEVFGCEQSLQTESIWRVRDILYCGVLLAGSSKIPIAMSTSSRSGSEEEVFVYTEETNIKDYIDADGLTQYFLKLKMNDLRPIPEEDALRELDMASLHAQLAQLAHPVEPKNQDTGAWRLPAPADPNIIHNLPLPAKGKAPQFPIAADAASAVATGQDGYTEETTSTVQLPADPSDDSEMIDMVNKLLDKNDEAPPQKSPSHGETSYGMGSATAGEAFGWPARSPVQPSPVSKSIPNLPWEYFYTPTQGRTPTMAQEPFPASEKLDSPFRASFEAANSTGLGMMGYRGNEVPQRLGSPFDGYTPGERTGNVPPGAVLEVDQLRAQRSSVLDSLSASLLAQHGFIVGDPSAASSGRPNVGGNIGNPLASPTQYGSGVERPVIGSPHSPLNATRLASQPRIPGHQSVGSLDSFNGNLMGLSTGSRSLGSPTNAIPNRLSVNSPERSQRTIGTPGGTTPPGYQRQNRGRKQSRNTPPSAGGRAQNQQPLMSPYAQSYIPTGTGYGAASSSLAISHPSSLYTGTPPHNNAPAGLINTNGILYNGTTPFGRMGNVNQREDPTHYQNKVREMMGERATEDSDTYDRAVLAAALVDTSNNPRQ